MRALLVLVIYYSRRGTYKYNNYPRTMTHLHSTITQVVSFQNSWPWRSLKVTSEETKRLLHNDHESQWTFTCHQAFVLVSPLLVSEQHVLYLFCSCLILWSKRESSTTGFASCSTQRDRATAQPLCPEGHSGCSDCFVSICLSALRGDYIPI